jgi:exonuclease III
VAATCGGIRVYSLYVPNGRQPDSDHYRYKLAWRWSSQDSSRGIRCLAEFTFHVATRTAPD